MPEPEDQEATSYAGLIIFLCTLPVLLFFTHIGQTELGLKVGICLGVMIFAVGMCWDLKEYSWFWVIIGTLLVVHVPLIRMIQWPHMWVSRFELLPIGLVDLLLNVGVIRLAQKLMIKSSPAEGDV